MCKNIRTMADLERYGDTRVVSVEELTPYRQMQMY